MTHIALLNTCKIHAHVLKLICSLILTQYRLFQLGKNLPKMTTEQQRNENNTSVFTHSSLLIFIVDF